MPHIPYVDPESADDRTTALLQQDADLYGQPSLFARVVATNPDVFEARSEYLDRLLSAGEMADRLGELVYLAVSVANDCEYCIASHREVLVERVGLDSATVEAVARGDLASFSDRERAAITFARRVALDPKQVSNADYDSLRDVGFDDADIVRLLTIATAAISANTIADALDIDPGDRDDPFTT